MGAAVAMIVGGAILNATAFVGGSYIAKAASGDDDMKEEHEKELKRHDLALENFNKDREVWLEHRQKVLDFIAKQKNLEEHLSPSQTQGLHCSLPQTQIYTNLLIFWCICKESPDSNIDHSMSVRSIEIKRDVWVCICEST